MTLTTPPCSFLKEALTRRLGLIIPQPVCNLWLLLQVVEVQLVVAAGCPQKKKNKSVTGTGGLDGGGPQIGSPKVRIGILEKAQDALCCR